MRLNLCRQYDDWKYKRDFDNDLLSTWEGFGMRDSEVPSALLDSDDGTRLKSSSAHDKQSSKLVKALRDTIKENTTPSNNHTKLTDHSPLNHDNDATTMVAVCIKKNDKVSHLTKIEELNLMMDLYHHQTTSVERWDHSDERHRSQQPFGHEDLNDIIRMREWTRLDDYTVSASADSLNTVGTAHHLFLFNDSLTAQSESNECDHLNREEMWWGDVSIGVSHERIRDEVPLTKRHENELRLKSDDNRLLSSIENKVVHDSIDSSDRFCAIHHMIHAKFDF
jgi:hypothetical protein